MAKGNRKDNRKDQDKPSSGLIERTVKIKRCAAVVKGGRRFSFAAMVVCGDGKGKVGWGYGKANEVQPSVEKANKQASNHSSTSTWWMDQFHTGSTDDLVQLGLCFCQPVLVPVSLPALRFAQFAKLPALRTF